jgi:S-layer homology domain.
MNLTVESNNSVLQSLFKDYASISPNLRDYVYTAYKNGIMIGSNSEFKPQDNLTRAEAATLLQRILNSEKVVLGNGEKVVIGGSNAVTTDDSDARLKSIWINSSLLSSFSYDTYVYNVKLPEGTTTLPAVSALTLNQTGAAAVVNQTSSLPGYAVIVVTSEDKTQTKTYIIYFTVDHEVSNDALLKNLTVNGTTVSGFDAYVLTYNVVLPAGTTTIPQVNAVVNDTEDAVAVVVPATGLPGTTTVLVTAEDGVTTRVYSIKFTVVK